MTLYDRLSAIAGETPTRCPAQRFVDSLPTEEQRLLADLLADPNISTFRIWQELKAEGYSVGRDTISMHRQGRCYCKPEATA